MTTHESRLRITLLDQVSSRARAISAAIGGIEKSASSFTAPFRSLTGQILAFGGAYLGVSEGIKSTAGAAIQFESAFADVRKVVDANEEQFDNMRRTIRKMSTELPLAANDIAALFAAAGESGIATSDLKSFAEMAARVGIAFDMTAGEAGESLAKLKTQLGLTVAETGDMADAINHLSNNMASKAKDITAYMLRVGALAEMGGFTKEQIAGIGSAMIAAGAEAETAGTAMQNVVKALTRGSSAKKAQREVAEALGLSLPQIAKDMQKDAPKALRKVLTAIAKTPKDRHLALLSDFFGDEAKAFAPLIGNVGLLDQALNSVGDRAQYAGSAFREYVERSNTTANVLALLQNKFSDLFLGMGERMLPSIKEAATGIGDVLDTLGERASIFDKLEVGIKGFAQGLGYGGLREVIDDLGDLFFGKIDPAAGDQLGRIFMKAREWGASVRELSDAIQNNPIAKFFADLAPYGLQIMVWGTGFAFLAGTVRKLAGALMLLSGASTILAALKMFKGIDDIIRGGRGGVVVGPGSNRAASGGVNGVNGSSGGWGVGVGGLLNLLNVMALASSIPKDADGLKKFMESNKDRWKGYDDWLEKNVGSPRSWFHTDNRAAPSSVSSYMAMENARRAREAGLGGNTTDTLPGKAADDLSLPSAIRLDEGSINSLTQPRGIQDVKVTNPSIPNITLHMPVTVQGVTNPEDLANQLTGIMGRRLREEIDGIQSNLGYGVA